METSDRVVTRAASVAQPRLRGWLHLGSLPLSVSAGIVLVSLSPDATARWASAVFGSAAAVNFGSSAALHRGRDGGRFRRVLRRVDHASIFVLIAGTYTPFGMLLLGEAEARRLLGLVWGGAAAGVAFSLLWAGVPRWVYVAVYMAMGCAAVLWIDDFAASASTAATALLVAGGLLYLLGGAVYGARWPNPSERWFGYHEVFHALTTAGFALHYVAVSLIVYGRR